MAKAVDDYYSGLFGSTPERRHALMLNFLGLEARDLTHLEVPFTIEEVEKTVKGMPLDKAPGPDGFTGRFYASCWNIIKVDLM